MSPCALNDETLKRRRSGRLTPIGVVAKTCYRDGNITYNGDRDTHKSPSRDKHYSARGPRNGRSTSLTPKELNTTLKRDDMKCVTTFMSDQKQGEQKSKIKEAKYSLLENTYQTSIKALTGQSEYLVRISYGTKKYYTPGEQLF